MRQKLLIIFLLMLPGLLRAQHFLNPVSMGMDFSTGTIIKNHPEFPEVTNSAFITGLHLSGRLNGTKPWHRNYNYAEIGFNFVYGSIGNDNVLGNVAAAIPEIIFSHELSPKWKITWSGGIGISYFNTPYDQVSNPENIVIGSHLTFCAMAAASIEYKISSNFSALLRPSLYHSSNSHTALPNVGMNLPLIGVGVKYFFNSAPAVIKSDSAVAYDKNIHFNMRLGLGLNEQGGSTGPPDGPEYPVYIASFFITKNISFVNKLQLGMEGWYNTGVHDYITSQDFYDEHEKAKSAAVVLFLGHEFLMGHFSLLTQGGIYLYNPFYRDKIKTIEDASLMMKLKTVFPARIGYQYYLYDATVKHRHNFFAGIYIKTNLGQADFLDMGVGYTF